MLDRLPPMLEIVGGALASGAASARLGGSGDAPQDDFRFADSADAPASAATFDFGGAGRGAAATATEATARPRAAKATAARPRRKEKSAVAEAFKVVLGGIVGLFLAQLILWWLPEPYKRDPAELGPVVGKYAPWIVPADFRPRRDSAGGDAGDAGSSRTPLTAGHGAAEVAQAQSPNGRTPRDTSGGDSPPTRTVNRPPAITSSSSDNQPNLSSEPLIGSRPSVTDDVGTPTLPGDPLEIPEPDLSLNPGVALPGEPLVAAPSGNNATTREDAATRAKTASRIPPGAASASQGAAQEGGFLGVADAPMYVRDEVREALALAQAAQSDFENAEAAEAADASKRVYAALTVLAERLTYADPNDQQIAELAQQTKALLSQGNIRERAKMLMTHGPVRLSATRQSRENSGIVLFGRVQGVEKTGELYELRLEMPVGGNLAVMPAYSKDAPPPGATVIILGTLVEEPQKRLRGYQGGLPSVVWMGEWVALAR